MLLVVPGPDPEPWPTIGPQVCDFIEERGVYGPGSLQGQPYVIDPEFRAFIYRACEVYPRVVTKALAGGGPGLHIRDPHPWAGRRRFKRVGLSVRKGLAKCLAPETPVLLADGREVRADQVGVGDAVLGYDDATGALAPARVAHVEVQPATELWRITTERGRSVTVTAEHPMLVRGTRMLPGVPRRRRYASCDPGRDAQQWVRASEVAVGDRLVVGLGWKGPGSLSTGDAWLLGAFTGDGSPDGRFTSEDPEIIGRIGARFPMTHLGRYDYYPRGIRAFLRQHDALGHNSRAKRVPVAVTTASTSAVAAFLAGYLDTDGWASFSPRPNGKTHAEIAWGSVNRGLLGQCQSLLAGLGINASICESRGTYQGHPHLSWNLAVRDTVQASMLADLLLAYAVHPRKRAALRRIAERAPGRVFAQRDTDRVTAVEPAGVGESIAIEVEGVHTHVTGGLVTHNTEKQALLVYVHIHPEGPGRCDGFDAHGDPVAAPIRAPYVPMLAFSLDQVEELAYGALTHIIEHGPDADMFDVSLERALRLDELGRADGGAWPLAQSPDSRDGARTTLNAFDEPHRLYMPRHLRAHETMDANLPKRPLEDPWSLYVGTAGELGQRSVAEQLHTEAEMIRDGKIDRPDLCYLYRTDDGGHDLSVKAERIEAVAEATGPAGEWGPGQFDEIASKWDRPGADTGYLERVWLNRWVKSAQQAFDMKRWADLCHVGGDPDAPMRARIPSGALVGVGFDGARRRDATGLVITEIATGTQELHSLWEKPLDADEAWEIVPLAVDQAVEDVFATYRVWRMYADPPYWVTEVGEWSGRHKGLVEEWWTNRYKAAAYAVRAYREAQAAGAVGWVPGHRNAADLSRHIGNAGKVPTSFVDDDDQPLFILGKIHPDRKFDAAMAGLLSWQAYLDAVKAGAAVPREPTRPRRIR